MFTELTDEHRELGWRDMDTAPRDGSKFLALTIHGEVEVSEYYELKHAEYVQVPDSEYFRKNVITIPDWNSNTPIGWRPLPPISK